MAGTSTATLLLCVAIGAALGIVLTRDAGPAGSGPAGSGPAGSGPAGSGPAGSGPAGTGPAGSGPAGTGPAEWAAAAPPTRIRIPRIRVDATLTVLRLDRTGRLVPPADYADAGWFGAGPAPGDVGPAVIAGHVDSTTGPAVFHRLPRVRPGDRIEVRRGGVWLPFRVTAAGRYAKVDFPTAAVYDPTPGPELRLVTCAGVFDRRARHYRDNLVVFAVADLPVVLPRSAAD